MKLFFMFENCCWLEAPPSVNRADPTAGQLHDGERVLLFLPDATHCVDTGRMIHSPNYRMIVLIRGGTIKYL